MCHGLICLVKHSAVPSFYGVVRLVDMKLEHIDMVNVSNDSSYGGEHWAEG